MSKEHTNNKLVPELRFPNFESEWKEEPLSEIYSFKITNSLSRAKLNYENGKVKNIHYGDIHTKFSTLFDITKEHVPFINLDVPIERIDEDNYCKRGDIIFADASEDIDDIGKSIEIINLNNEKLLAGLHTFLARQINPKLIFGFGGYLFKSNNIRTKIKKESQGAKVLGISKGRLSQIKIFYPKKKEEQQKIANCLSSLDDLIKAQSEKLEALKDYKKGLLQQLFPAEGERVPKLRFSEFEKDGEWNVKELGNEEISIFVNKKTNKDKLNLNTYVSTENLLPNYEGIKKANKLPSSGSFTHYKKGDILIANIRPYLKKVWFAKNDGAASNDVIVIRAKSGIQKVFLLHILKNDNFIDYVMKGAKGVKMPRGDKSLMKKYPLSIPQNPKEQQSIADSLSSVDDIIVTQSDKIDALKAHKKGLIQQLFPNINEQ